MNPAARANTFDVKTYTTRQAFDLMSDMHAAEARTARP